MPVWRVREVRTPNPNEVDHDAGHPKRTIKTPCEGVFLLRHRT
jgi:hypothetical protein